MDDKCQNPSNTQRKTKLWGKDFILIMLATACVGAGNFFFMTTLPIYAQRLTGSTTIAGLMTAILTISALIARPISGILVDKYSRVKIAIIGASIVCVSILGYNFGYILVVLILFRILHGLGFGMHSTATLTAATDIVPASRRMEGIGYLGLFNIITMALGPAFALYLISAREDGFSILFLIAGALALVAVIANFNVTYEKNLQNNKSEVYDININKEEKGKHKSGTILGFEKTGLKMALVLFIYAFAQSTINTHIAVYAQSKGLGNIGLFFTMGAAAMFIGRLFGGRIGDRFGPDVILIPALLVASFNIFIIGHIDSTFALVLVGFPSGLVQSLIIPTMNVIIVNNAPPEVHGSANGTFYAALDMGLGSGALFWGFIADMAGYSRVYATALFLPLLALLLYLFFEKRQFIKAWIGNRG